MKNSVFPYENDPRSIVNGAILPLKNDIFPLKKRALSPNALSKLRTQPIGNRAEYLAPHTQ